MTSRRKFLRWSGTVAGIAAVYGGARNRAARPWTVLPGPKSPVSILRASSYSADLAENILRGVRLCGLKVRGKRVVLKPNLVDFDAATVINTHASVLAAAVEVFERLGAREVRIAEGPGHRRDTMALAEEAGYRSQIRNFEERFVDLNRDDVAPVRPFATMDEIYLPQTVLNADLIVSVAKMKTHHWAGATLSLKNFFGVVPGSVYGWPKNQLHQIGIDQSIAELHRIFSPRSFAIVDGIVGMEGNGPIQGEPKAAGVLVMGSDLVAVDATCCRIMGILPERVEYLKLAAARGQLSEAGIEQRGERVCSVTGSFKLIPELQYLRAPDG